VGAEFVYAASEIRVADGDAQGAAGAPDLVAAGDAEVLRGKLVASEDGLLDHEGIVLNPHDRITPPVNAPLTDGMQVKVNA
jgi:hypothetical protein